MLAWLRISDCFNIHMDMSERKSVFSLDRRKQVWSRKVYLQVLSIETGLNLSADEIIHMWQERASALQNPHTELGKIVDFPINMLKEQLQRPEY